MRFSNAGVTIALSRQRRRRFRDLPIIPCWPPPLGRRTRPEPLTLKRLLAARLVFILGMSSSQGGRLYSIRPANGALFLHPRYGFWIGAGARVQRAPGNRSGRAAARTAPHLTSLLRSLELGQHPVLPQADFSKAIEAFGLSLPGCPPGRLGLLRGCPTAARRARANPG